MRIAVALVCLLSVFSARPLIAAPFVPTRDAQCVDFSPNGRLVVTGKSGMSNEEFPPRPHPTPAKAGVIQIWDAATGKMLRRMETFGDLRKVRFSPNGQWVASCRLFTPGGGLQLSEVRLWDVESGRPLHVFDRCHDFDFASDGKSIVVLSRSKCVQYDLATFEKQRVIKPLGRAISVAWDSEGQRLAGIVPIEDAFEIRITDVDAKLLRQSPPLDEPFYSIVFSADSARLASGHTGGRILLWDAETMQPVGQFQTGTRGIARPFFSPDGRWLGGGCQDNGDVLIWELATGNEMARFTHEQGTFHTYFPRPPGELVRPEKDPRRFAFGPHSDTFVSGCFGGIIRTLAGGQEVRRFRD